MTYSQVLRNRSLFYLWLGQLVSRSGDFVFDVAVVWLVFQMTGSVFNVGVTVGTSFLPSVLIGPVSGVYVDRFNRRRILLVSNAVQAAICGAIAVVYYSGISNFPLLLVLLFSLNGAGQFTGGSVSAMLPRIVPRSQLAAANGLFSVSTSFNQLLTYGIGGVAILAFGPDLPIFYDAFTFLFALTMISFIPRAYGMATSEGSAATPKKPFRESFLEGISFIRANRILLEIVALALAANFFGGSVGALMAPYAQRVLGGNASFYGFLLSSSAVGALAGALVTGRANVRDHVGTILFGGLAATGALVALLGFVSVLWEALVVSVAVGFFEATINLPIQVLVQAKIPGTILGRTIGTLGALVSLMIPLAAFASGTVATLLSIPLTFEIFGGMLAVTAVVSPLLFGELRTAKY